LPSRTAESKAVSWRELAIAKLPCPEGTKEVGDDCVPLAEFE
jgi:hypothetical protein